MSEFSVPHYLTASYLDGVYLAINAIPDAYLVYHAHDCGHDQAEKIAGHHDLFSDLLRWNRSHRVKRTQVEMTDYIMGGQDKLSKTLWQVLRRHRPGIVFVVRNSPMVVSGQDVEGVLGDLSRLSSVPLVILPEHHLEREFVTGYLDVLAGLMERLRPQPRKRSSRRAVLLAGYFFGRHEGDHLGDVEELKRMLRAIGCGPVTVMLDGNTYKKLSRQPAPELVVDLASAWQGAKNLAQRLRARYLCTGLPLGISATSEWLLALGRDLKRETQAENFVRRESEQLSRSLQWLVPRFFAGKSAMVFADRLLLGPLARFLEELGFIITGIGCTSACSEAEASALAADQGPWPSVPAHLPRLERFLARSCAEGKLELIIGNSIIHQVARHLPVAFVEIGYPSDLQHFLQPSPLLGFSGVRLMVQRLLNALIGQSFIRNTTAPTRDARHGKPR